MLVFEILIEVVGYSTARLLLPLVSFGKIRAQPINDKTTPFGAFNMFGYRTDNDGTIVVEATQAAWLGFLAWIAIVIVFLTTLRSL